MPSQGYNPHIIALEQTDGTAAQVDPSHPYQQFSEAAAASQSASQAASQAASPFPLAMSSPFAQAGYPAASDPWATNPNFPSSSQPSYADPGFPSCSQQQSPWAAGASHHTQNPWDPRAAAANPWDTSRGDETPAAVLNGDNGGLDSVYRSTDGRPAMALLLFGFAGKTYCWRPTASPGVLAHLLLLFCIGLPPNGNAVVLLLVCIQFNS